MWRLVTPIVLLVVAAGVYQEGHDGDGQFYVFPLVEHLPGVTADLSSQADASVAVLVAVALGVGLLNLVLRSRGREA